MKQYTQTRLPEHLHWSPDYNHSHLCLYCGKYGHLLNKCLHMANSNSFLPHVYISSSTNCHGFNSVHYLRPCLQCDIQPDQPSLLRPLQRFDRTHSIFCLYCGKYGHLADNCFHRSTSTASLANGNTSPPAISNFQNRFLSPFYQSSISLRDDTYITQLALASRQPQGLKHPHLCLYCGRYGHLIYNCFNKPSTDVILQNTDTTPSHYSTNPTPVARSLHH